MMPADPTTLIAALGVEPTYSPRETALLLGRSYSWLDQRLRAGQFMLPDGTKVEPRRTAGGYQRFTLAMLEDIALSLNPWIGDFGRLWSGSVGATAGRAGDGRA
jgi:hypothetical protein